MQVKAGFAWSFGIHLREIQLKTAKSEGGTVRFPPCSTIESKNNQTVTSAELIHLS